MSAVPKVEINDQVSTLNDDAVDPAARAAGHQPALTGCPWHDVNEMLQAAGLRPTRQRMALGWLLFGKGARHLTAEMLYEEATLAKVPVSLATVYNTLNQLTDAGLLRQVSVDGTKTYFDTNVTAHHHFYLENNHELVDIPDPHLVLSRMPEVPEGYDSTARSPPPARGSATSCGASRAWAKASTPPSARWRGRRARQSSFSASRSIASRASTESPDAFSSRMTSFDA